MAVLSLLTNEYLTRQGHQYKARPPQLITSSDRHVFLIQVVCSHLSCGPAIEAPIEAYYGEGTGPIWMDEVLCTGRENDLDECIFLGWGIHNCGHSEDASVRCEGM